MTTLDEPIDVLEAQAAEHATSDRLRPAPSTASGRPPQHHPDLEAHLVGAMLSSGQAVATAIAAGVSAEHLYGPNNRAAFAAILRAHQAGHATFDPAGPAYAVLAAHGLSDRRLIDELHQATVGYANVSTWADLILAAARDRKVEEAAEHLRDAARHGIDLTGPLKAVSAAAGPATSSPARLPGFDMADLLDTDLTLNWMVRGLLCHPTYGQVAGELKTLKSHLASILAVSVASGRPYLGRFAIDQAQPVTLLVGEGGRIPFVRRLHAITTAMGIDDPHDLPLRAVFEVAPIGSDRFRATIDDELDKGARLIVVDPLYAYHGTTVNSANLHEEGSLLTSISSPCVEAEASLLVVNHFNQTGTGSGLKRITQAGSGEWVDSWLLTRHRQDPDVANGDFKLELSVGSRQWGGSTWDVDLHLGRLDPTTGHHHGDITWNTRPTDTTAKVTEAVAEATERITSTVREHPGLSKEKVAKAAGGRVTEARRLVDRLADQGVINRRYTRFTRQDGRDNARWAYFHPSHPGTGQDELGDQ